MKPKFEMGRLVQTQGVLKKVAFRDAATALSRHISGDYGDICEDDVLTNNRAVECGGMILSVYKTHDNIPFWIITDIDRRTTTILLPDEY